MTPALLIRRSSLLKRSPNIVADFRIDDANRDVFLVHHRRLQADGGELGRIGNLVGSAAINGAAVPITVPTAAAGQRVAVTFSGTAGSFGGVSAGATKPISGSWNCGGAIYPF